ncbi:hypothetical protein PUN28_008326 [Cardiocondyla obscurior]|uniref:BESS domain-containing protein n=1 Tax=Cardiocondyla obscurior TaxID=286306 RepID=A0AAW2EZI9_9HYME
MLTITNAKEGDSLLVDLVKSYPHIYDKQNKDFKDIRKKNNSWQEIGNILGASESYESDDDFLSSMDTTITNDYDFSSSSQDLQTPPTFYKPNEATGLARSEMSSVSDITSETDKKSISPALSIDSSAIVTSNVPKRFKRETKHTSSADKVEESFLKLTSVVSSHFENKTQNSISFDMTDEDDIFGKTVACQLRKISEPRKSEIKGQLMKILFTT